MKFSKIKRKIEDELNKRLSLLGYPKRSKTRDDYYIKPIPTGYHGLRFVINDHGDVATRMYLLIRIDKVAKSEELTDAPCPDWLDPREFELGRSFRPTFDCPYEYLAGVPDGTYETIAAEDEIPRLCDLWRDRFCQVGPPFFAKYSDLASLEKMVRADDPELTHLCTTDGMRYVIGAALIHAVDGHKALLKYAKEHESRYVGMYRDMIDRLIAASEKANKG